MAQEFREGDVFSLPLAHGGFGVGVLARRPRRGTVVLCYFFGPRRKQAAVTEGVDALRAGGALLVCRLKDTGLHRGSWRVIGAIGQWRRDEWPVPPFIRKEGLSQRGIRVEYGDDNLTVSARETAAGVTDMSLADDIVFDEQRIVDALERVIVEQTSTVTVDPSKWTG